MQKKFTQILALGRENLFLLLIVIWLLVNIAFLIFSGRIQLGFTDNLTHIAKAGVQFVDQTWEPEIKKTEDYTAVLIMGIDSRILEFDGEEFGGKDRDIDTIIQVIYNHDTGKVMALSVPRDTGYEVEEECTGQHLQYFKSINHLYRYAEDGECKLSGVEMMMKYVSRITGFDNHYYSIISYDAFRDIIEAIGEEQNGERGLTIDVPRNIYDYYPSEHFDGFEAVYFPQGEQFINSTDLLKYARVRKSSTDFERAARQQQVVTALVAEAEKSGALSNPVKLYELYQAFSQNALFSDLTLDDIRGAVNMAVDADLDDVKTIVLDDTLGDTTNSLLTKPRTSGGLHSRGGWYLSPMHFNDPACVELEDDYCKVKEYLQRVYTEYNSAEKQPVQVEIEEEKSS